MLLYIAEKPSTMILVKKAYEKSNKPCGDITFVALAGHVCGLLEPKEYDQWKDVKWKDLTLPMVPDNFRIKSIKPDLVNKIRDLLKSSSYDGVVVGTDSDVEGNGIYALLEKMLHLEKIKAYRFFETDLTDKGIMNSFSKLTDFHTNPRDVGMTQAYWIRAQFDWLIGFNLSVAYSVKTGMLMRVGRVKAPTLKLVYDNCKAIDEFDQKFSYLPVISTKDPAFIATMIDETGKDLAFPEMEKAKQLVDSLGPEAVVKKNEKKITRKPPQQLYKLSDIQVEAGQKYGYSPDDTLSALQSLYETHKVLSYPRTDGKYISTEKAKEFSSLLRPVSVIPGMQQWLEGITPADMAATASNKRYVNDEEVKKSSHGALIPTGKIPDFSKMTELERNICTMVYKRFLAIFLPDLVEEKSRCIFDVDGNLFISRGSTVKERGFTAIFDTQIKERLLPNVEEGQRLEIGQKGLHEVVSKPPKRLTQATLVDAMENIQKYMTDKDLKKIMKEAKGIGMPSSRAKIIKDLISTGYMEEKGKGKGLYITQTGKEYIEYIGDHSIVKPELSAEWETHIKNVRQGSESYGPVREQVLEYVNQTVEEVMSRPFEVRQHPGRSSVLNFNCPVCGKPMRTTKFGYGCTGYPNCRFLIGEVAHKKLTEKQVRDLLTKGQTGLIKGFKKKDGNKFDAMLKLENEKLAFAFPPRSK